MALSPSVLAWAFTTVLELPRLTLPPLPPEPPSPPLAADAPKLKSALPSVVLLALALPPLPPPPPMLCTVIAAAFVPRVLTLMSLRAWRLALPPSPPSPPSPPKLIVADPEVLVELLPVLLALDPDLVDPDDEDPDLLEPELSEFSSLSLSAELLELDALLMAAPPRPPPPPID